MYSISLSNGKKHLCPHTCHITLQVESANDQYHANVKCGLYDELIWSNRMFNYSSPDEEASDIED
jgi:hypothetical protein